jgi:transcriptional regulator with XRE-family HTH domain
MFLDFRKIMRLSLQRIGEELGVSMQAVHNRMKQAGIPRRPQNGRPLKLDEKKICRLYTKDGLTMAEVAKRMGVSMRPIVRVLTENGIPPHHVGTRPHKYLELEKLKVGESKIYPRKPNGEKDEYLYRAAKRFGIRIRVRDFGKARVRVTRIA